MTTATDRTFTVTLTSELIEKYSTKHDLTKEEVIAIFEETFGKFQDNKGMDWLVDILDIFNY